MEKEWDAEFEGDASCSFVAVRSRPRGRGPMVWQAGRAKSAGAHDCGRAISGAARGDADDGGIGGGFGGEGGE